jgi:hypothetical protein
MMKKSLFPVAPMQDCLSCLCKTVCLARRLFAAVVAILAAEHRQTRDQPNAQQAPTHVPAPSARSRQQKPPSLLFSVQITPSNCIRWMAVDRSPVQTSHSIRAFHITSHMVRRHRPVPYSRPRAPPPSLGIGPSLVSAPPSLLRRRSPLRTAPAAPAPMADPKPASSRLSRLRSRTDHSMS